jgi:hypothetical protein
MLSMTAHERCSLSPSFSGGGIWRTRDPVTPVSRLEKTPGPLFTQNHFRFQLKPSCNVTNRKNYFFLLKSENRRDDNWSREKFLGFLLIYGSLFASNNNEKE